MAPEKTRANEHTNIPTALTTEQAAAHLNRKPRTLNKWALSGKGPIQPVRINGRLAWPADQIATLLQKGEVAGDE